MSTKGQNTRVELDLVKAGIIVNGVEEQTLRDHLVMHCARLNSYENPKQEVFDIHGFNRRTCVG